MNLHPLTKKLNLHPNIAWHIDDMEDYDKIIRVYLEERAEWLKGFLAPDKNDYIDQAFQLTPESTVEKETSMQEIEKVFISDCHGIEMIKTPSGKDFAIGGTNTPDRFLFNPWNGKPLYAEKERCSCGMSAGVFAPGNIIKCCSCGKPIGEQEKEQPKPVELPAIWTEEELEEADDCAPSFMISKLMRVENLILLYLAELRKG